LVQDIPIHLIPIDLPIEIDLVLDLFATTVTADWTVATVNATCIIHHRLLVVFGISLLMPTRIGVLKVMKVTIVAAHAKVIEVTDLLTVTVHQLVIVLHEVVKVIEAEEVQGAGKVKEVLGARKVCEVQGVGRVVEVQGAEKVTEPEGVVAGRDQGIGLIHHRIVLPVVVVVIIRIETRQDGAIVLMMTIMTTSRCPHRLLNFL
jgi:hypothetical protein